MLYPANFLIVFFTIACALPLSAGGFDAPAAEAIIAKNQKALVEIKATAVIKCELLKGPPAVAEMIAQKGEQLAPVNCKGIVIHSSGIIAAPLTDLDPGGLMAGGMEKDTPLGKVKIGLKVAFTDVKIITEDGHEIPAEIIFKEPAANLCLLKISTPLAEPMTSVTLAGDLPPPLPFSSALALSRLGARFNRAPVVYPIRVIKSTPPSAPYHDIVGPHAKSGSAIFNSDGLFIGMAADSCKLLKSGEISKHPLMLPQSEINRLGRKFIP